MSVANKTTDTSTETKSLQNESEYLKTLENGLKIGDRIYLVGRVSEKPIE
jgi:hypothetical protein